jgi:hypothetical protein
MHRGDPGRKQGNSYRPRHQKASNGIITKKQPSDLLCNLMRSLSIILGTAQWFFCWRLFVDNEGSWMLGRHVVFLLVDVDSSSPFTISFFGLGGIFDFGHRFRLEPFRNSVSEIGSWDRNDFCWGYARIDAARLSAADDFNGPRQIRGCKTPASLLG